MKQYKKHKTAIFVIGAIPFFLGSLLAEDQIFTITEPQGSFTAVSNSSTEDAVFITIKGEQPENLTTVPEKYTVGGDAAAAGENAEIMTSNKSENGGVIDPNKTAVKIDMESGTVLWKIAGARNNSNVYGNIEINVKDGSLNNQTSSPAITEAIVGTDIGTGQQNVYGNISINVGTETTNPYVKGNIFAVGGGTLHGNTSVVINGGTFSARQGIYGGSSWGGVVKGDTYVEFNGGTMSTGSVAGGSYNSQSKIEGSTSVKITGGTLKSVYGGDSRSTQGIGGNVNLEITGGSMSSVYGNSASSVGGNININIDNAKISSSIYGASSSAVGGDVNMNISNSEAYSITGASYKNVGGKLTMNLDGVNVSSNVTGASNAQIDGEIDVKITGGTVIGKDLTLASSSSSSTKLEISSINATIDSSTVNGNINGFTHSSTYSQNPGSTVENLLITVKDSTVAGDITLTNSNVLDSAGVIFAGNSVVHNGKVIATSNVVNTSGDIRSEGKIGKESFVSFGDGNDTFSGTYAGEIEGVKSIKVSANSDVSFEKAFDTSTLYVDSTSKVSLVEGTSFDNLNVSFAEAIETGANFDFDLAQIFGDDLTIVQSAIENDGFTITSESGKFFADYENGHITVKDLAVPEPSTYAAIFGAIALAFAAYRKRR